MMSTVFGTQFRPICPITGANPVKHDIRTFVRHANCTYLRIATFSALLVLAQIGCEKPGFVERHTLVDSRDSYDPRSLDPALSTDVPTGRAVAYVFDGLTQFSESAEVLPNLATSWRVSPNGRTYVFRLKQGVKFHDGTPFTASDVERSFKRVLDPAVRGGRGWPLYPILGAQAFAEGKARSIVGLVAVDDSTLMISLSEPFAIFPKMLAMPVASIVPKKIPADFGEHPIGTGPWKFVEWRHDDHIRFVRNDDYHGGAPEEDSLEARIIPEASTGIAEFESGNVDIVSIPAQETRTWEGNEETRALLQSIPSLRLIYAAINTSRGPLRDPRVRQAINYGVDTRMILDRLMGGRGTRAAGVIPPSLEGFDGSRIPYAYDTAKARQLLVEAGYPDGIDIELWCSQSEPFPRMAQTIQAYLARINVRVKIVQRDASSMREAARNGKADMALKDWFADYPDAEAFLYPLLHSVNFGVGGNVSFYKNRRIDDLIGDARGEQNASRRASLYRKADSIAFEESPMLYLFFYKELFAVQPWIKGFHVPSIFNGQRWTKVSITRPAKP